MAIRHYLLLLFLGLVVLFPLAFLQKSPGYMDADYYYITGIGLSSGKGFHTDFLWNYLSDPLHLPIPSHSYWMPLTSLLVFIGSRLFGTNFFSSRILIILVAGCIPPLTAKISYNLTSDNRQSMFAGLLSIVSGFYLVFLPTTDSFGIYMFLGALFFLYVHKMEKRFSWFDPLILGGISGFFHLTRADGVLWLIMSLGLLIYLQFKHQMPLKQLISSLVLCSIAYAVFMMPWFVRNVYEFGSLFPPGGSKALWLTNYDDLFRFPASEIDFNRWRDSGWGAIVLARTWALGQNLQTFLAVQGGIVLLPLICWGMWRYRHKLIVQTAVVYWLILLVAMTIALPFPGARGSFFHSGSAVQPLLWAVVPVGLERFVSWGQNKRGWKPWQARPIFQAGLFMIMMSLSVMLTWRSLGLPEREQWGDQKTDYEWTGEFLQSYAGPKDPVVMVNNPPGFYLATEISAIVIPSGPVDSLREAADRFAVDYVVLESDKNWPEIYAGELKVDWLKPVAEVGDQKVFMIRSDPSRR